MRIVDVSVLQGRSDAEMEGGGCHMTHLRASHVRIEGQMWMNAVCEVGMDGQAKVREGWGL